MKLALSLQSRGARPVCVRLARQLPVRKARARGLRRLARRMHDLLREASAIAICGLDIFMRKQLHEAQTLHAFSLVKALLAEIPLG